MRRDRALASLSRDHHQALVAAQLLQRATEDRADDARRDFLSFWRGHGRTHFALEEKVLLPTFARHGDPHHALVARALCDHVDIRQRADALTREEQPAVADLRELGVRLAAHVRLEERELFPLVEETMPPDALAALAGALARMEADTTEG
jgi:hemerythrin-like domain-containing protein